MSEAPDKRAAGQAGQRHMLAATSVTGLASVGNIALSVVRVKVIALLVGPAGIGLLGLYLRLTTLVATLSGLGLSQSGVREVAAAKNPDELARTRRALMSASLVLGLLAAAVLLIFKRPIARAVFEDTTRADEVAWLGLAVLMTGLATAQTAYLQGLRKIKQAALVTVGGALVGSLVGIAFVVALGADGLVAVVIASPTGGALVAWLFARRARREAEPHANPGPLSQLVPRWRSLVAMGVTVMVAQLASNYVSLEVRARLVEDLGLATAGHFEASWQISMTYIGFVLTAMGADFFPRLTAAVASARNDRTHPSSSPNPSHRLVNDQTEVALLLAAPVLIGLAGLAPVGIHILYSSDFEPSILLLRIQALGDTLRIVAWPLAYLMLAHGRNRLYLAAELLWSGVFFGLILAFLPTFGLTATAIAYTLAFAAYLAFLLVAAKKVDRLTLDRRLMTAAAAIVGLGLVLIGLAALDSIAGLIGGVVAVLVLGYLSLDRLARILEGQGRIGRLLHKLRLGR